MDKPADPGFPEAKLAEWLERLRKSVERGAYSLRPHVFLHAYEEGFEERHVVEALVRFTVLEAHPEQARCLICGRFRWSEQASDHLHIVVDFSDPLKIDLITAYLPRRPQWIDPFHRGDT